MCIAFSGPSQAKVDFAESLGSASVCSVGKYYGWHLLSYQNTVIIKGLPPRSTNAPKQWKKLSLELAGKSGAAMMIVIPLAPNGDFELLSAEGMPNFLEEMTTDPHSLDDYFLRSTFRGTAKDLDTGGVQVKHYGLYDVVVFKNATVEAVRQTIAQKVRPERQPEVDADYIEYMVRAYNPDNETNFAILLFCYDPYSVGLAGTKSLPVTIVYQTAYPNALFFPGLDQHDPLKRPDLDSLVMTDHRIAWGYNLAGKQINHQVKYTKRVGQLGLLVPDEVVISSHHGLEQNGDFVLELSDLRDGKLNVQRWKPPLFA